MVRAGHLDAAPVPRRAIRDGLEQLPCCVVPQAYVQIASDHGVRLRGRHSWGPGVGQGLQRAYLGETPQRSASPRVTSTGRRARWRARSAVTQGTTDERAVE